MLLVYDSLKILVGPRKSVKSVYLVKGYFILEVPEVLDLRGDFIQGCVILRLEFEEARNSPHNGSHVVKILGNYFQRLRHLFVERTQLPYAGQGALVYLAQEALDRRP